MRSCFFIGHRDAPTSLQKALHACILERIVKDGVNEFVVGHYGAFDRMSAEAVIQAKKEYPHLRLVLLAPYHPALRPMPYTAGFDGIIYPFERRIPPKYAIVQANKKMIEYCDYLIAYVRHPGKARDFLVYALQQEEKGRIQVFQL